MRQRIYVHILFTLRLSADLYTVESLQISVNGPGGELSIVDRLHRRLRHPRQVAAAEDTRLTGVRRPRGQFLIFSFKGTVFPKSLNIFSLFTTKKCLLLERKNIFSLAEMFFDGALFPRRW